MKTNTPKQDRHIGSAEGIRENWGFIFSDDIEDWKTTKRLASNRTNSSRYIKKKDRKP